MIIKSWLIDKYFGMSSIIFHHRQKSNIKYYVDKLIRNQNYSDNVVILQKQINCVQKKLKNE